MSAQKYTVEQYVAQARAFVDSLNLDLAAGALQKALQLEPSNTAVMDELAGVIAELGDMETAAAISCCALPSLHRLPVARESRHVSSAP